MTSESPRLASDRLQIRPRQIRPRQCGSVTRVTILVVTTILAALTGACQAPTAPGENPAYDPTRLTNGLIYRWTLGATVAVHVDTTGQGAIGINLRTAVEHGITSWRATWRYGELRPVLVATPAEADVIVQLRGAPPLVELGGCAASIVTSTGRTVLCPAGDSARTLPLLSGLAPGHVKVAIDIAAEEIRSTLHLDAMVAHELGHAFGLGGHSMEPSDLMNAAPTAIGPSARDARTLRYVLHQAVELRL